HRGDVRGEGIGAGVERGLVARADLYVVVLHRRAEALPALLTSCAPRARAALLEVGLTLALELFLSVDARELRPAQLEVRRAAAAPRAAARAPAAPGAPVRPPLPLAAPT